jgi:hypothetical protein
MNYCPKCKIARRGFSCAEIHRGSLNPTPGHPYQDEHSAGIGMQEAQKGKPDFPEFQNLNLEL